MKSKKRFRVCVEFTEKQIEQIAKHAEKLSKHLGLLIDPADVIRMAAVKEVETKPKS